MSPDALLVWLVVSWLVMPAVFVANHAHQLGHAVVGQWLGYDVRLMGSGLDRPLIRFRLLGVTWFVGRTHPVVSYCLALYPAVQTPRWRAAVYLLAGPLTSAVLCLGCATLAWHSSWTWVQTLFGVQAVFCGLDAVVNLIPLRAVYGTAKAMSDGALVLNLALDRSWVRRAELIGTLRTLVELADAAGDWELAAHLRRLAAKCWAEVGAGKRADELLAEAGEPTADTPTYMSIVDTTARAAADAASGRVDAALAGFAAAAERYTATGDTAGRYLAEASAAQLRAERGYPRAVAVLTERWAGHPVLQTAVPAAVSRLVALTPRLRIGDPTAADALITEVGATPTGLPFIEWWHGATLRA